MRSILTFEHLPHGCAAPHKARQLAAVCHFIEYHNHHRYYESLKNLPSADAYFGRGKKTLEARSHIKRQTLEHRRLLHRKKPPNINQLERPNVTMKHSPTCPKYYDNAQ